MAQRNLDAARQLIAEKRYEQARAILKMSHSPDAEALLHTIDQLELSEKRLSPFQFPYVIMLLLGLILPVLIAFAGVAYLTGGVDNLNAFAFLTPEATAALSPTPLASPTSSPTASVTSSPSPTTAPSATPSLTPMPSATPTEDLPPTWTRTSLPTVFTPDRTATALAQLVATNEALVAASQTVAVNPGAVATSANTATGETRGIVGTPDADCQNAARLWWRNARLLAADSLFALIAEQDQSIERILSQAAESAVLRASLGDNVEFMTSLRSQIADVGYPACASTARDLALAYFGFRIRIAAAIAASDQAAYETNLDQATTYLEFFERELGILSVSLR